MFDLIDPAGNRLDRTAAERAAFLAAVERAERDVRLFCEVLHFTGCRISEPPALTVARVDLDGQTLVIEALKKRRRGVYRVVSVPQRVIDLLVYGVAAIGATVPLDIQSKWMRHAAIETKAIYADASHDEQRSIAERM